MAMYNKKEVLTMLEKSKKINRTTAKKIYHHAKLEEIRNFYNDCMAINDFSFNPDYDYNFQNYRDAMKNFKTQTKKELDKKLYLCILHINSELIEILNIIDTYIWDEESQKYIEKIA